LHACRSWPDLARVAAGAFVGDQVIRQMHAQMFNDIALVRASAEDPDLTIKEG
jgi:hypothetical protein